MHELGIVLHTIDSVEKIAEENHVQKVLQITLEVGEVSGIVPNYFKDCFEWAKKRTKHMQECELNLVVLEALSYCRKCKTTFKTMKHAKKCPTCHEDDTYLVTGDEINIHDIKVLTDDESPETVKESEGQ